MGTPFAKQRRLDDSALVDINGDGGHQSGRWND